MDDSIGASQGTARPYESELLELPQHHPGKFLFPCWKPEDQRILLVLRSALPKTPKRKSFRNHRHMHWHRIVPGEQSSMNG
jgi:hypothetical protein